MGRAAPRGRRFERTATSIAAVEHLLIDSWRPIRWKRKKIERRETETLTADSNKAQQ